MTNSKMPVSKAKTAYGLLGEVAKIIVAQPERYDHHDWFPILKGQSRTWQPYTQVPACGTVGCVAGWIVALKHPSYNDNGPKHVSDLAANILGMDVYTADRGLFLANVSGKPQTFRHAKAGAKAIETFRQKYATQLKATKV